MEIFFKITGIILLTSIISVLLQKQQMVFSLLLIICVCCITLISAAKYLSPVYEFVRLLVQESQTQNEYFTILLKIVGISLISQIATLICIDTGNQSLGKVLQIITTFIIVGICIPLIEEVLILIKLILGAA